MTACCARHGQEEVFGEQTAANDARKYRRRGPDPMARALARRAAVHDVEGASVLEIGGGVGQVALELLPAYEPYVRALAFEAGVGGRMSFRTADLVVDPAAAAPVDVVVMNKVVCCTPDGVALAGIAASLARRRLVLSFPRQVWWARAGLATVNGYQRLRNRRFRVFVHPQAALEGAVEARGLVRVSERNGPLFRITAFERV